MSPQGKETVISITAGTVVKTLAIIVGLFLLYALRDLVLVIITAVIVASSIEPAVRFLGRYRIHRIPAVLGVYVSIGALLAGAIYAFLPALIGELYEFSTKIPHLAKELDLNFLEKGGTSLQKGGLFFAQVAEGAPAKELLLTLGKISEASQSFVGVTSGIFGGFFSFILIVILSFYFAMQERGIENFLKIVIPFDKEAYVIDLWKRSKEKIGKWMQGQLILGVLIFVLVYLGLTIFGVPYALILAMMAGVLEIIPVFGPIMAAIPAVLLAFASGGTALALWITGFYLLVQQFESNLIYPLVVRKIVGVPPIIVILALIIGAQLAGFLGLLIAIPVVAALMEVVDDIERKKRIAA